MTALFAFQFLVVGSRMSCIMPNAAMTGAMGRTASGAMMQQHQVSTAAPTATQQHADDTQREMPCDQQRSMPVCQAMGPCVTALAATPIDVRTRSYRAPSLAIAMVVLAPPLPTFPPESPPPRA